MSHTKFYHRYIQPSQQQAWFDSNEHPSASKAGAPPLSYRLVNRASGRAWTFGGAIEGIPTPISPSGDVFAITPQQQYPITILNQPDRYPHRDLNPSLPD